MTDYQIMEKYVDDRVASMTDEQVCDWLKEDLYHEFSNSSEVEQNYGDVAKGGIESIRKEVEDRMYMAFTSIVPDEEWVNILKETYGEGVYQEMLNS